MKKFANVFKVCSNEHVYFYTMKKILLFIWVICAAYSSFAACVYVQQCWWITECTADDGSTTDPFGWGGEKCQSNWVCTLICTEWTNTTPTSVVTTTSNTWATSNSGSGSSGSSWSGNSSSSGSSSSGNWGWTSIWWSVTTGPIIDPKPTTAGGWGVGVTTSPPIVYPPVPPVTGGQGPTTVTTSPSITTSINPGNQTVTTSPSITTSINPGNQWGTSTSATSTAGNQWSAWNQNNNETTGISIQQGENDTASGTTQGTNNPSSNEENSLSDWLESINNSSSDWDGENIYDNPTSEIDWSEWNYGNNWSNNNSSNSSSSNFLQPQKEWLNEWYENPLGSFYGWWDSLFFNMFNLEPAQGSQPSWEMYNSGSEQEEEKFSNQNNQGYQIGSSFLLNFSDNVNRWYQVLSDSILGIGDNIKDFVRDHTSERTQKVLKVAVTVAEVGIKYSVLWVTAILVVVLWWAQIMMYKRRWIGYTVEIGDSIESISSKFTMTTRALKNKNKHLQKGELSPGMKIKVRNRVFIEKNYLNQLQEVLKEGLEERNMGNFSQKIDKLFAKK